MTIPRRGRITLKERRTGAQLYESHLQSASENRMQEELTFKAQSNFQEGKSINTNVNTDVVALQHSIVGHQYLHKQSKISSELGDISLNDIQLRASMQNSRSQFNVHLKAQQSDPQRGYPNQKDGAGKDDQQRVLNTQNNTDIQNSLLEQADINICHQQYTNNDLASSYHKTTKEEDVTMFKITDISAGLQSSGATVQ